MLLSLCREVESVCCLLPNEGFCWHSKQLHTVFTALRRQSVVWGRAAALEETWKGISVDGADSHASKHGEKISEYFTGG